MSPLLAAPAGLAVHLAEATPADLMLPVETWLTGGELRVLSGFHVPKRRRDWLLGRWAAKRAVARCLEAGGAEAPLHAIEVLPAADGAPEVRVGGGPVSVALSISHTGSLGFAGARADGRPLGVDVETVEPRSARFLDDYFTPLEAARVRAAPADEQPLLANLTWSAKEAALKALRSGLRLDTRAVEVEAITEGSLAVRVPSGQVWEGRWWEDGGVVRTVVAGGRSAGSASSPELP